MQLATSNLWDSFCQPGLLDLVDFFGSGWSDRSVLFHPIFNDWLNSHYNYEDDDDDDDVDVDDDNNDACNDNCYDINDDKIRITMINNDKQW
jgi:hypothetical protein